MGAHETINPYGKCLANSRKVNWDIDRDVIRFRTLDINHKYLPDSLSLVQQLAFLAPAEQRFFSQVQGRTYAYLFGLVERFINAKILEIGQEHALGDQVALEALMQFSTEEMKHQELFRRMEKLADAVLPPGYTMTADANDVARAVLSKSTWAILGLTCHVEIFTQVHYRESLDGSRDLSPLFRDVFRYHWMEEAQHATLDELEWQRVHERLSADEINDGVYDLIDLVMAVDGILQQQAGADAAYFTANAGRSFNLAEQARIRHLMLKAYRWQYIVSGLQVKRFQDALAEKVTADQLDRIQTALTPIVEFVMQ